MFGDFLLKQMLKRQGVPGEQVDALLALVKKNPEFFQKIAAEVQEKVKQGKSQQDTTLEVMQAHQEELQRLTQ